MTGRDARLIIKSLKRQLLMARLLRDILLAIVVLGLFATLWSYVPASSSPAESAGIDGGSEAMWTTAAIAVVAWVLLTVLSVRQVRNANQASTYIASGRLDLAEAQLKNALQQFSLYRNGKLMACHNLAVVTHGQKDYRAAAELCDGLISLRKTPSRITTRTCRILLGDCRMMLGDPDSAWQAIESLSTQVSELSLTEQLLLLPIELRCQMARGDHNPASQSLSWKVKRAELLDSARAALVHALLASACRHTGDLRAADFLFRRAEIYYDLEALTEQYQILRKIRHEAETGDDTSRAVRSADNI